MVGHAVTSYLNRPCSLHSSHMASSTPSSRLLVGRPPPQPDTMSTTLPSHEEPPSTMSSSWSPVLALPLPLALGASASADSRSSKPPLLRGVHSCAALLSAPALAAVTPPPRAAAAAAAAAVVALLLLPPLLPPTASLCVPPRHSVSSSTSGTRARSAALVIRDMRGAASLAKLYLGSFVPPMPETGASGSRLGPADAAVASGEAGTSSSSCCSDTTVSTRRMKRGAIAAVGDCCC